MKTWTKIWLLVTCIFMLAGTSYAMSDFIAYKRWNYKITIEVETPEGIKTGFAVRQVQARRELAGYVNPGSGVVTFSVIGEAAIVDLGKRGIFLELPTYEILRKAFPYKDNNTVVQYYNSFLSEGRSSEIDAKAYSFITFSDIANPQSIRTVRGADFEKVFGQGVHLKHISVEITNENVTWGQVRKYLKWYDRETMGLPRWDPKKTDQAQYYTKSDLIKGEQQ